MTAEERDQLIEAAEELKRQRTRETCLRVVVSFQGKEWAPNRFMRDRYFLVNVPKNWGNFTSDIDRAQEYIGSATRFPVFFEMLKSLHYEPGQVRRILSDEDGDCEEIT